MVLVHDPISTFDGGGSTMPATGTHSVAPAHDLNVMLITDMQDSRRVHHNVPAQKHYDFYFKQGMPQ